MGWLIIWICKLAFVVFVYWTSVYLYRGYGVTPTTFMGFLFASVLSLFVLVTDIEEAPRVVFLSFELDWRVEKGTQLRKDLDKTMETAKAAADETRRATETLRAVVQEAESTRNDLEKRAALDSLRSSGRRIPNPGVARSNRAGGIQKSRRRTSMGAVAGEDDGFHCVLCTQFWRRSASRIPGLPPTNTRPEMAPR